MYKRNTGNRVDTTKRVFDIAVSSILLVVTAPIVAVAIVLAALETKRSGLFKQARVGRNGQIFKLMKIRTMHHTPHFTTTVTTGADKRITRSGAIMRRLKVDELPQLLNVLRGDMSIVGPRPDVPGFADNLNGDDRRILAVRPGITGPATIAYRHEEELLSKAADPERFNREVIWPDKIRLNREYVDNYTLVTDIRLINETVKSVFQ